MHYIFCCNDRREGAVLGEKRGLGRLARERHVVKAMRMSQKKKKGKKNKNKLTSFRKMLVFTMCVPVAFLQLIQWHITL